MKKIKRGSVILAIIVFALALASLGASASAPQVVATSPAMGDGYVSSELTEISVTFDQPMNITSYSVALQSKAPWSFTNSETSTMLLWGVTFPK